MHWLEVVDGEALGRTYNWLHPGMGGELGATHRGLSGHSGLSHIQSARGGHLDKTRRSVIATKALSLIERPLIYCWMSWGVACPSVPGHVR